MGANARQQLGEPERLDEIVVGAGVESGDDVELLIARGEDQDRELRLLGAQAPADLDPVDVGQPEVEDHEADAPPSDGDRRRSLGQSLHGVALAVEHANEPLGDAVVVFDQQDLRLRHAVHANRGMTVQANFDLALTFSGPDPDLGLPRSPHMAVDHTGGRMQSRKIVAAGAVTLALSVAGCGSGSNRGSGGGSASAGVNPNGPEINPAGDIPDNQAFVRYVSRSGGFSVKVPEGWAQKSTRGAVTFSDKLNSIRVETVPAQSALTVGQATRSEVPKLAAVSQGFRLRSVSSVSRSVGNAVRTLYLADSAPDPVTGKVATDAVERYVFFHKGRDVNLTLTGAKGADNVDPWRIVTDSLRWTR